MQQSAFDDVRLLRGNEAIVPLRKLTEYLLSESHPVGSSKAVFFRKFGFDEASIHRFEDGLLTIARSGEVIEIVPSSRLESSTWLMVKSRVRAVGWLS
jgi:hypothetical protein